MMANTVDSPEEARTPEYSTGSAARGQSPAVGSADPTAAAAGYFRSTRVPRIFWALIVFRKVGSRRSINSKNDDSAGVCVFWL